MKKNQSLRPGCYLMWFKPTQAYSVGIPKACIGTFRVTNHDGELRASSDLYEIPDKDLDSKIAECTATATGNKSPSMPRAQPGEIPIFPLENYLYYLEVLGGIEGPPTRVRLNFRGHRFDSLRRTLVAGSNFQIELTGTPNKNGNRAEKVYPDKLTGELFKGTENGGARGELVLQYIGKDLRRAHLRIIRIQRKSDEQIRVPGESLPRGVSAWKELFQEKIGWQLEVSEPDGSPFVQTAPDKGWAPYDLGLAAMELRKPERLPNNTGHDWVYDLLCVPKFAQSRFLGMMFDAEATDLNGSPRESAAVAALETVTVGQVKGDIPITGIAQELFGGRLYYRTALHELGHAMNLTHTLIDNSIMNTTDFLLPSLSLKGQKNARKAMKELNDAFNPEFAFSPKDREWLQHAPDIAVRPGGISRNAVGWVCECKKDVNVVSLRNASQAELLVNPVLREVPFGAPVRLNYTLLNHGPSLLVPVDLSLTQGVLSGRVVGPDRQERYFRSLFRCCDSNTYGGHLRTLIAGDPMDKNGVTLLRGTDGPLFPLAGTYNIKLELRWDESGRTNRVVGRTSITVSEASDPDHGRSAEIALNEPKLMPAIVQGLLDLDGLQALSRTLNSPTLAPHYVSIALNCYRHGHARRFRWNDLFEQIPRPLGLAGGANAGNGQSVGRTRALKTSAPPPLTEVERKGLEKLFQRKPRSKQKSRSKLERPSKVEGRSNHVVNHSLDDMREWLERVMQVTQPPTAAGKETIRHLLGGVGAAVSGKLMVQRTKESSWPQSGPRSIQPMDPKKPKK